MAVRSVSCTQLLVMAFLITAVSLPIASAAYAHHSLTNHALLDLGDDDGDGIPNYLDPDDDDDGVTDDGQSTNNPEPDGSEGDTSEDSSSSQGEEAPVVDTPDPTQETGGTTPPQPAAEVTSLPNTGVGGATSGAHFVVAAALISITSAAFIARVRIPAQ